MYVKHPISLLGSDRDSQIPSAFLGHFLLLHERSAFADRQGGTRVCCTGTEQTAEVH